MPPKTEPRTDIIVQFRWLVIAVLLAIAKAADREVPREWRDRS